jgi:hypothetical protein
VINANICREGETFLASSVELQTHAHHVSMAIWEVKIIQRLVCKCSSLIKIFSAIALMYGIHACFYLLDVFRHFHSFDRRWSSWYIWIVKDVKREYEEQSRKLMASVCSFFSEFILFSLGSFAS